MVKDHVSEALELFESGFSCSQAVLMPFSEELSLPRETAIKISCSFGGGLGGAGKTCGALTGAIMVVGLKCGKTNATDQEAKKLACEKTRELVETFEKVHGSTNCNELIGFDRSNLSAAELLAKKHLFHNKCPEFLETVVSFLEEEI